ncbi:chitinase biding protein [Erinnyis ello granulovirus]|uniref:Chitinase biding protein n=1 Tax=Erinnyis ello granulovirus TaxID=307444 RepID=A0A097DAJ5_9BBAC|nr:chitinase biding protein [Erinnyis ello granulovirus]AIS92041.1 chitinase biding protein [Erinnyis ello granulovirus]ARX71380.1 chitinase biding protein [Erinnyis ello granulovirus]ARX71510.1 chitinase biding protein [Erinnyis ello granulovirus]ARX71640.1 chitinase biding protein [Erinnyis ello granulovirus]ARX71770.1 chitinase biding protein [Erinnyis ello granulovirus]
MTVYYYTLLIALLLIMFLINMNPKTNNDDNTNICPDSYVGFLPDPYLCNKFHFCFDSQHVEMFCPEGAYFDVETLSCAYSDDVIC